MGVVSGTGLARILICRLMDGDAEGHIRRALAHFPFQEPAQEIVERYFISGGKAPDKPYRNLPAYTLQPPKYLDTITVIANFVEVFLAKEGHNGLIGINLLEKVQMPNMASLYGAMFAGVDYVLMGAGIPIQVAGILDKLALHEDVTYRIDVIGADKDDDFRLALSPKTLFPNVVETVGTLKRPQFLPIISSVVLAQALLKRSEGAINGFVIEGPLAGGHNAPPRGPLKLNEIGEPIYGEKDNVDLEKMKQLGLPFWLAGTYGSADQLKAALEAGAAGIQVGTAFAFCDESGMDAEIRQAVLRKVVNNEAQVFTDPVASPTGFPFKVVLLEDSMSDTASRELRNRVCDMGFLRSVYKKEEGDTLGYRCPAEPIAQFVKKGGRIEETVDRTCLCNNLAATAGFPQVRKGGFVEKPLVTAGNDLVSIGRFIPPGETHYSARQVIDALLSNAPGRQHVGAVGT
jgi:nitronate monooxygenase